MKKIVLKTIAITLAGIVLLTGILYGVLALFSPITLAKLFDGMGMYSASITYYEKNFEKTALMSDLDKLILKIDVEEDSHLAEKYLKIMVESEHFDEYCQSQDQFSQSDSSSREYYLGEYVYALILNGKFDEALEVSCDYIDEYGYTQNNPIRIMVFNAEDLLNENQTYNLKQKIYEIRAGLSGEEQTIANLDIDVLAQLV